MSDFEKCLGPTKAKWPSAPVDDAKKLRVGARVRLTSHGVFVVEDTSLFLNPLWVPDVEEDEVGKILRLDAHNTSLWHCRFQRCTILVNKDMVEVV